MNVTTAHEFRKKLKLKVDQCIKNHEVLKVQRRNGENFIVLGEEDWRSIEESLYLNQFPGFVDSVKKSEEEPLEKGTKLEDLDW